MKHFRKVWTPEINTWMIENKELPKKEMYRQLIEKFGLTDVTYTAFSGQRSLVGATTVEQKVKRPQRPLYSEHEKKGYIWIKTAMPSTWTLKHVWVWNQTHPDDPYIPKKDCVIFLDRDTRNFSPDNLIKVPRQIMGLINNLETEGLEKGNPEKNKIIILMALNKHLLFERAEKLGLCTLSHRNGKVFRRMREEVRLQRRAYIERLRAEGRYKDYIKKNWERLKNNPEKYAELLRKNRERRKQKRMEFMKMGLVLKCQ